MTGHWNISSYHIRLHHAVPQCRVYTGSDHNQKHHCPKYSEENNDWPTEQSVLNENVHERKRIAVDCVCSNDFTYLALRAVSSNP